MATKEHEKFPLIRWFLNFLLYSLLVILCNIPESVFAYKLAELINTFQVTMTSFLIAGHMGCFIHVYYLSNPISIWVVYHDPH